MKYEDVPKYVFVGGHKVIIQWEKLHGDHGEYRRNTKSIVLNTHLKDEPANLQGTFFHELIHASMHISGWECELGEKEEGVVSMLENILLPAWNSIK